MVLQDDSSKDPETAERAAQHSDQLKSNWQRVLQDMNAMAADREDKGFETLAIPAGDTTPKPPDVGDTDRFGLTHVIPNNFAEEFSPLFEAGDFDETAVYQNSSAGFVYLVSEHIDMDGGVVIFVAGSYEMRHAPGLVRAATERDEMYTHLKTLDGTHLGAFEHDDVSAFFPDPDKFYAYDMNR